MRRTGRDIDAGATHTHAPRGEGGGREGGGGSDLPPATACPTSTARVSIWRGREASGSVDTSSKREHQHLSGEQTARAKQTGAARVRRTPGLSMARRLGGRCTVNSRSTQRSPHGQLNGQLSGSRDGSALDLHYEIVKEVLLKARQRGGRGGLAPLRQFNLI